MKLHTVEQAPRAPGLARTLILLHGYGADEQDLLPIAHALDPRLRAVSLQGPLSLGGPARAWFHLRQDAQGISFDPAQARAALTAAADAVEEIARTSPRPILLGFSQGAAMALGVLLTRPELVAGVLSLSGVPPLLGAQEIAAREKLQGLPAFVAHGTQDPLLPVELAHGLRDQLTGLGLAVTYREYPMGHMVLPEELAAARAWLLPLLG